MTNYYVALDSRSHAFLLERRMKSEGIECEISFVLRAVMNAIWNMGVKFGESVLDRAINLLRYCGLPGVRLYREIVTPSGYIYSEVQI